MADTKKALVVRGGWDGHMPVETTDLFIPFLRDNGFDVQVSESTAVYADDAVMADVDLIVQIVTMSTITDDEFAGLQKAVLGGAGLAGWHGGIADAFRNTADYLHIDDSAADNHHNYNQHDNFDDHQAAGACWRSRSDRGGSAPGRHQLSVHQPIRRPG